MRCVLSGGVPFLKACPSRRCALPGGVPYPEMDPEVFPKVYPDLEVCPF